MTDGVVYGLGTAFHSTTTPKRIEALSKRPISVIHSAAELDQGQAPLAGYVDPVTGQGGAFPMDQTLFDNPRYRNGFVLPFLKILQLDQPCTWEPVVIPGPRAAVSRAEEFTREGGIPVESRPIPDHPARDSLAPRHYSCRLLGGWR